MKELTGCIVNGSNCPSLAGIADELGCTSADVYAFIQRGDIQAAFTLVYKYDLRAALAKIATGIRRKKGCNGNGNSQ